MRTRSVTLDAGNPFAVLLFTPWAEITAHQFQIDGDNLRGLRDTSLANYEEQRREEN